MQQIYLYKDMNPLSNYIQIIDTQTHKHTHTQAYKHTQKHTHTHTIYIYLYIYIYIYIYINDAEYIYIYIHIYIYIQYNLMETQTRLSRHNKIISAENITILSVSSNDFLHASLQSQSSKCGQVWLAGFYGISTFVGYLTPNPFLCK